jgi:cytochrome c-type biogenesis protein CcmH/NrfG
MSENQNNSPDRKGFIIHMWLISLAVSVLCCALFSMLTSFYVKDINRNFDENLSRINDRLAAMEVQQAANRISNMQMQQQPVEARQPVSQETMQPSMDVQDAIAPSVDVPAATTTEEVPSDPTVEPAPSGSTGADPVATPATP